LDKKITFELNGRSVSLSIPADVLLADVLRDILNLTGTKKGCGIGQCGVCTVLLDGKPIYSCLTFAVTVDGRKVVTIEGLKGKQDELHPVQEAFIEAGALQCGFCTPSMVLAVKALLDQNPSPNREEVVDAISGNLCRCTGYEKIIEAALAASQKMQE
jgi:aerobic-type carbon monoxide dehydrogenase small subunit (CoxS/CutS family)